MSKFASLRKSKKLTQAQLAEKMLVSIELIHKWDTGSSVPPADEIKKLSQILGTSQKEILDCFMPSQTKVEQFLDEEDKMYKLLLDLILDTKTAEQFIALGHLFSNYSSSSGIVTYSNYIFPFTHIKSEIDGNAIIFLDDDNNMIVLTINNIKTINPISTTYDVYTFSLEVGCPIFPVEGQYCSQNFSQHIKVSIFNR